MSLLNESIVEEAALSPLALQQLHQRPQHPVHRCRNAQRRAALHDQAIEVVDLAALAARQVLRGGRMLANLGR